MNDGVWEALKQEIAKDGGKLLTKEEAEEYALLKKQSEQKPFHPKPIEEVLVVPLKELNRMREDLRITALEVKRRDRQILRMRLASSSPSALAASLTPEEKKMWLSRETKVQAAELEASQNQRWERAHKHIVQPDKLSIKGIIALVFGLGVAAVYFLMFIGVVGK